MNWKKIKRVLNSTVRTDLEFNWSMLILLAILVWQLGPIGIIYGGCAYAFILLHEWGHVFASKWFGVYVHKVQLNIWGGAAMVNVVDLVKKWKTNLIISAAGPIVSMALGILILALYYIIGGETLFVLGWLNLIICVFNLFPIFPSDGGRILYSLLYRKNKRIVKSINITANISYALCGVFTLLSIVFGYYLMAIFMVAIGVTAYFQKDKIIKSING